MKLASQDVALAGVVDGETERDEESDFLKGEYEARDVAARRRTQEIKTLTHPTLKTKSKKNSPVMTGPDA